MRARMTIAAAACIAATLAASAPARANDWTAVPGGMTDAQRQAQHDQQITSALADLSRRLVREGRDVHAMSLARCDRLLLGVPSYVFTLGPKEGRNPYLLPQENYCLAKGRATESPANNVYPGMLPEGMTATYLGNGRWWVHY